MVTTDELMKELDQEAQTTRRVLARVPNEKLTWRPHKKARTLGELAMHVAIIPGALAELIGSPSPAQMPDFKDPILDSTTDLLPKLEESLKKAKTVLQGMDEAKLTDTWRLMKGSDELFAMRNVCRCTL